MQKIHFTLLFLHLSPLTLQKYIMSWDDHWEIFQNKQEKPAVIFYFFYSPLKCLIHFLFIVSWSFLCNLQWPGRLRSTQQCKVHQVLANVPMTVLNFAQYQLKLRFKRFWVRLIYIFQGSWLLGLESQIRKGKKNISRWKITFLTHFSSWQLSSLFFGLKHFCIIKKTHFCMFSNII